MEINKDISKKVVKLHKIKSNCPNCNSGASENYMPFCSQKCSDLDLMKWLSDNDFSKYNL